METSDLRTAVTQLFDELASIIEAQSNRMPDGAETHCAIDSQRGNFLVVRYGWHEGRRVRGVSLFVRVSDDEVCIEEDMTDWNVVDRLIELGVPADRIVLPYQSPQARPQQPAIA